MKGGNMGKQLLKMYDQYDREMYYWLLPPIPKRRGARQKVKYVPRPTGLRGLVYFIKHLFKELTA